MDERDRLAEAVAWVMSELRFERLLARLHEDEGAPEPREEARRPA